MKVPEKRYDFGFCFSKWYEISCFVPNTGSSVIRDCYPSVQGLMRSCCQSSLGSLILCPTRNEKNVAFCKISIFFPVMYLSIYLDIDVYNIDRRGVNTGNID